MNCIRLHSMHYQFTSFQKHTPQKVRLKRNAVPFDKKRHNSSSKGWPVSHMR